MQTLCKLMQFDLFFFLIFYLLFGKVQVGEEQREGDRRPEAGSALTGWQQWARFGARTLKPGRSWPELKWDAQPTEPPRGPAVWFLIMAFNNGFAALLTIQQLFLCAGTGQPRHTHALSHSGTRSSVLCVVWTSLTPYCETLRVGTVYLCNLSP